MKLGSLFSGGGLGDFGFMAAGMEIAWQCEIDEYCQKILALRYPESKKYRDIKNVGGLSEPVKTEGFKCGEYQQLEPVDIITGGFPCQPFSYAGNKNGTEDSRYLWPQMSRVIEEVGPRWVVAENVPGIIDMELNAVCSDLETKGYEVGEPVIFPSHALGAWHKRDRVWIVAYRDGGYRSATNGKQQNKWADQFNSGCEGDVADSDSQRVQRTKKSGGIKEGWKKFEQLSIGCNTFRDYWKSEPAVGRVASGITDRIHRLKMLGNGQVPVNTYVIGKMIMEIEKGKE